MKNEDLEQRSVAALSNDGASVTELAELIREVETAFAAACATAEEARRQGVNPLLSPDPVLARERVKAAEFAHDRMGSLLSQLETRHRRVAAAEHKASWEADYERVKAERDRLAAELATTYPQVVATLVNLLARVAECQKECGRVAETAASGEPRRLLGPELHAKRLTSFTRDMPSFTRDLRLPNWERPATAAWPPRRTREVLTFAPAHSPADWWRAGEARSR
jgi:hypothetical protein